MSTWEEPFSHPECMVEFITVVDPDLQIKGGGGSSQLDPEIREGGLQKVFSALQTSVWSKNKGGGGCNSPLDLPLYWGGFHFWDNRQNPTESPFKWIIFGSTTLTCKAVL